MAVLTEATRRDRTETATPPSVAMRSRLTQLPHRGDASRFVNQLRRPTRVSALRGVFDGAVVTVTLKKRGVRCLVADLAPMPSTFDPARALEVSAAVDAAFGLIPVAPTCLRRTLTLIRELKRLGLEATMHVGVRNVGGTVEAHAWVQARDVVLNDNPDVIETYTELAAGDLERLLPALR